MRSQRIVKEIKDLQKYPPTFYSDDWGIYGGVAKYDSDIGSPPRKMTKENRSLRMPFHLKCRKCGTIIAKGADLKIKRAEEIGTYRNTPIGSLTLKCLCGQTIEIEEVPQKCEYKVVRGGWEVEETDYYRWTKKKRDPPPLPGYLRDADVDIQWPTDDGYIGL